MGALAILLCKIMQAVILAAGESSRFWPLNQKHKTLLKVFGKPLICHLIEELKEAGVKDIIIVQGPKKQMEEGVKNCRMEKGVRFVVQENPLGTGDALLTAKKLINENTFFALNADDIDVNEYIEPILAKSRKGKSKLVVVSCETKTPWLFGMLKLKDGKVAEIIEKPTPGKEPSNLKNANFFFFPKNFCSYLEKIPTHPYSLIQAVNLYAKDNPVETLKINEESFSLKYPWHIFPIFRKRLEMKIARSHVSKTAKIGKNVMISGKVYIGEGSNIGENTIIKGPCYIGKNCEIGFSNVLRGPLNLEDNVKTGSFSEIKNTIIQEGTHIHTGYFGDSVIGRNCRIGNGFIVANRRIDRKNIKSVVKGERIDTGLTYFGTVVGDNTRFGIHVSVMPGVLIGSNCVIGPHSLVRENVPDNTTFYTKFEEVVKNNE